VEGEIAIAARVVIENVAGLSDCRVQVSDHLRLRRSFGVVVLDLMKFALDLFLSVRRTDIFSRSDFEFKDVVRFVLAAGDCSGSAGSGEGVLTVR
jgi:hypothetical protein